MSTEQTDVKKADINLFELLGTGVENIMTPSTETIVDDVKKNVFSPVTPDTSFLDKFTLSTTEDDNANPEIKVDSIKEIEEILEITPLNPADSIINTDDQDVNKGGRPTAAVSALKSLIDKNLILPFDDDKKLDDYSQADIEELIEMNISETKKAYEEEFTNKFFESLPTPAQYVFDYIAQGGTDLKSLFQSLASSQEVQQLDISTKTGQTETIRAFLHATRFGTPEEIEDEIISLEDRNELDKKAKQFKPKLDAMQEQLVKQRLANQEEENRKKQKQAQNYMENVYKTLETAELNGIKLDSKVQNMLYSGLVNPNYPSVTSGKQTNLLGHLLEKYQWVEPRHDLIAEALWLLADPDGYKNQLKSKGAANATEDAVRRLKTEQQNGAAGATVAEEQNDNQRVVNTRSSIPRPRRNIFDRN